MATLIPAKYTEVLGNIVDYWGINLFDFDYPLYVPAGSTEAAEKTALQDAFLREFYLREIGFETVERFKIRLQSLWLKDIDWLNTMRAARQDMTPSDAFKTDSTTSEALSVLNNAPKGVVNFDENHAASYTKTNAKGEGLTGKSKYKAYNELATDYVDISARFFEKFDKLFMQIF